MKALVLVVACGCGAEPARMPPDAAAVPPDAFVACTATFSGNFAELATTATACASAGTQLVIDVPAQGLIAPLMVTLAIVPNPGDFSSETTATWSAIGTRMVGHDTCVLDAGDQVVPHGSFTLHLATADHGTLVLDQPVRATLFSTCGETLYEHVEVAF